MTETPEYVEKFLTSLQGIYAEDTIKGWKTWPLILIDNTGTKEIGISVVIDVSPDYEYESWVIDTWKDILGADGWSVTTKGNLLQIKFNITHGRTRNIEGNQ